jgi:hypothetical protein
VATIGEDLGRALNVERFPTAYARLPALSRCGCHMAQLMVWDLKDQWDAAFALATTICESAGQAVSTCDTRWNSKYKVILEAEKHTSRIDDKFLLNDATLLLEPFAIVTRVLERDSATLFDMMASFQSLAQWFELQVGIAHENGRLAQRAAQLSAAQAVVEARVKKMTIPAVQILAFFAPSTDYDDVPPGLKDLVFRMVDDLCPPAREELSLRWDKIVFEPTSVVTKDDYNGRIRLLAGFSTQLNSTQLAGSGLPKLAEALKDLMSISASEASVERLFSNLSFVFNKWRVGRASATLVNTVLETASLWRFFHPSSDRATTVCKTPEGSKRHRAESTRENPIVAEDAAEADESFNPGNSIEYVCDIVNSARVEAPAPRRRQAGGRVMRSETDMCSYDGCERACALHNPKAFLQCSNCPARKSIAHTAHAANAAFKALGHAAVDLTWTCKACRAAGSLC